MKKLRVLFLVVTAGILCAPTAEARGPLKTFAKSATKKLLGKETQSVERSVTAREGREAAKSAGSGALVTSVARSEVKELLRRQRRGSSLTPREQRLIEQGYAEEAARDAATPVEYLKESRLVHRYTTRAASAEERRSGLAVGRHTTSDAPPGRPLSAEAAGDRYGLSQPPEVRDTWEIPAGTPVRFNKAYFGEAGVGEITPVTAIPPSSYRGTVPLE